MVEYEELGELYVDDDNGTTQTILTLPRGAIIRSILTVVVDSFSLPTRVSFSLDGVEIASADSSEFVFGGIEFDVSMPPLDKETELIGVLEYDGFAESGALDLYVTWAI